MAKRTSENRLAGSCIDQAACVVLTLTRPNNITTSYGYDSMSRLLSVLHKNSGGTTLDGAAYTYDNAGNRLTRTDKRTNVTLSYTSYDNIYELQTVKQGAGGPDISGCPIHSRSLRRSGGFQTRRGGWPPRGDWRSPIVL